MVWWPEAIRHLCKNWYHAESMVNCLVGGDSTSSFSTSQSCLAILTTRKRDRIALVGASVAPAQPCSCAMLDVWLRGSCPPWPWVMTPEAWIIKHTSSINLFWWGQGAKLKILKVISNTYRNVKIYSYSSLYVLMTWNWSGLSVCEWVCIVFWVFHGRKQQH